MISAGPAVYWTQIQPEGGSFTFQPAGVYAVLASVTTKGSLDKVRSTLVGKGFDVSYAWEEGTPTRGTYCVDAWLAGLSPDPTSGERWVYIEATFSGAAPLVQAVDMSVLWIHVYHIAGAFQSVQAGDQPDAFPCASGGGGAGPTPTTSTTASKWPWIVGGVAAVGAVGGGIYLWRRHARQNPIPLFDVWWVDPTSGRWTLYRAGVSLARARAVAHQVRWVLSPRWHGNSAAVDVLPAGSAPPGRALPNPRAS